MKLTASVITVIMVEHDSLHSWLAVGIFSRVGEMQKNGAFDSIWFKLFVLLRGFFFLFFF